MPGDGSASFASCCGSLASNDHFVEVVFGQVELGVVVGLEELFNGSIGIYALHRVASGFLGLNGIAVGHVVTAEAGVGTGVPGMEEREHTSAGAQGGAKALDHGADQRLGHIVERSPEQDDVEFPARKVEVVIEK